MTGKRDGGPASRQTGSLMAVVTASGLFYALTSLTAPRWVALPSIDGGVGILTLAHLIPLFATTVLPQAGPTGRLLTLLFSAAAGVAIFLHTGLSRILVANLDAGFVWSEETVLIVTELFFSIIALPIGLWAAHAKPSTTLGRALLLPTLLGAAGQVAFFIFARIVRGPSGLELWMAVRVLIMAAIGLTAGFFAFSNAAYRPKFTSPQLGGFTELILYKLPRALPFSALIAAAFFTTGALRIVAENNDQDRLITQRFDDYFLALSNLTRARSEGLYYTELNRALEKNRNALFGSAAFDPVLEHRLKKMIAAIETPFARDLDRKTFEKRVMDVNRRLLRLGEPYFLEPHAIGESDQKIRFVLRYKVTRQGRYGIREQPSIPMLRVRRIDDIDIDTPFAGLSYPGIGTVLMDHVEELTLHRYIPLFSTDRRPGEAAGKWKATLPILRDNFRDGILDRLETVDITPDRVSALAAAYRDLAPTATPADLRRSLPPHQRAVFDRIIELVARQTEVHEARHATDNGVSAGKVKEALKTLTTHSLEEQTVAEIRAYLTEIIDGPLGPRFGLATVGKLVIEPGARANAYFFAAIIILEGLWGEAVRRPDIIEVDGKEGSRQVVMPISDEHPGWLSFSRIHGAYADLSALPEDELKKRAVGLFESLFDTVYISVERRR